MRWSTMGHEKLLGAVSEAHYNSALNNPNASAQLVVAHANLGQPFHVAVAAALLSLGNVHGPIEDARRWIFKSTDLDIEDAIFQGRKIPGWGNDFHKEGIDPAWRSVEEVLRRDYRDTFERIRSRTELIDRCRAKRRRVKTGKLYPNPACFTAAAAEIVGLAEGTESRLFIAMRLPAWAKLYSNTRPRG